MKHPTNVNNGAVALRNEFSGMYAKAPFLQCIIVTLGQVFERAEQDSRRKWGIARCSYMRRSRCSGTVRRKRQHSFVVRFHVRKQLFEELRRYFPWNRGNDARRWLCILQQHMILMSHVNFAERERTSPCSNVAFMIKGFKGKELDKG
jgi:hypothetical protein